MFRPGGPLESCQQAPVFLIKNVTHCQDLLADFGAVNEDVRFVQNAIVAQIRAWVDEFYEIRRAAARRDIGFSDGTKSPKQLTAT